MKIAFQLFESDNNNLHLCWTKELDDETGYSYFGARYYDPNISIWLSVDPLSDKYPGLSAYAYTANNPIRLVDPNGMEFTEYENAKTKEVINVDDGIDERVQVSDADWGSIQQLNKDWNAGYKDADAGVAEILGERIETKGEGAQEYGDSDGQQAKWRKAEQYRDRIDNTNYQMRTKSKVLRTIMEWLFPSQPSDSPRADPKPRNEERNDDWKKHPRDHIWPRTSGTHKVYYPGDTDSVRAGDTMRYDSSLFLKWRVKAKKN